MPSTISTAAQANAKRVLDGAARRLLAQRITGDDEERSNNDHEAAANGPVGKAGNGDALHRG
jgi:hypothetical protein